MKKFYIVILGWFLQSLIIPQGFQWEWQNTKPNGNDLYEITALTSSRIIAFGGSGTQLVSTDAGESWSSSYIDDSRRDIMGGYFVDQNIGFVCGASGLLKKTTDGGVSWIDLTSGVTTNLNDVEFYDANNGLAVGASSVVLRTTDGGNTWTPTGGLAAGNTLWRVTIVNATDVLLGGTSSSVGRFLKSTNFGTSFTPPMGASWPSSTVNAISAVSSTNYWVANAVGGIFVSTDGGATFGAPSAGASYWVYDIEFINATTGFAGDQRGNLLKTTNTGVSWVTTALAYRNSIQFNIRSICYKSGTVFAAGLCGSIYKSTDDGLTWNAKHTAATQEILKKVIFTSSTNGYAFGGPTSATDAYGVVIKTTDGGANWSTLAVAPTIQGQVNGIAMPSANTWFLGCNNSKFYKTTDGGTTFSALTITPGTTTYNGVAFFDELTGYTTGLSGKVFKTTTGGTSWTDISAAANVGTSGMNDVSLIDANNVFLVGGSSRAIKTTDGGTTFTSFYADLGITGTTLTFVRFKDAYLGFVGGSSTSLSKTTNGGTTWAAVTLPTGYLTTSASITNIAFGNPSSLWITTGAGDVLYSPDNGTTWWYPTKSTTNSLTGLAVSGSNIWTCGTGGVILHSSDIALPVELVSFSVNVRNNSVLLSWQTASEANSFGFEIERMNKSQSSNWEKIGFVNSTGSKNVKTSYSYEDKTASDSRYSYRLKQIDRDGKYEYSSAVEVSFAVNNYSLEQNYPNPFNPTTTIGYTVKETSPIIIKLYDVLGNEVATLVNEIKEAGNYNVEFKALNITSGVYFYKMTAGNYTDIKKLCLLK